MKLIIVHYHLRRGGVRRVIELGAIALAKHFGRKLQSVTLAVGERADEKWKAAFANGLRPCPVEVFIEPNFNYFSERTASPAAIQRGIRKGLARLLDSAKPAETLVWFQNPGIGRNLLLVGEVTRACEERGLALAMHHHDWWFDNRWSRWREMRKCGFRTLKAVANTIFPSNAGIHHLAINQSDAACLQRCLSKQAGWLPNLSEKAPPPSPERIRKARAWLEDLLEDGRAPVWIFPCRFLRRKNIAEALLLTRWLQPDAWLVTTAGASSSEEETYFERLAAAGREQGWKFRPGILGGDESNKPSVSELMAASQAVLLTSIQEGFGLPYLEAAAAGRPFIGRAIPNVDPDLKRFGFRFPQYYRDLLINPSLFDWSAEEKRQRQLFQKWRLRMPGPVRRFVGVPMVLEARNRPRPVPFSRLTLSAQLEVLAQPIELSWQLCAPLNPFLAVCRKRVQQGGLQPTRWPREADRWLTPPVYARRFVEIISHQTRPARNGAVRLQNKFLRTALHTSNLFPLLWSPDT